MVGKKGGQNWAPCLTMGTGDKGITNFSQLWGWILSAILALPGTGGMEWYFPSIAPFESAVTCSSGKSLHSVTEAICSIHPSGVLKRIGPSSPRRDSYCWWLKSSVHQLRLVVSPIIYSVLAPSQVVVWDFFHQQLANSQLTFSWRDSLSLPSSHHILPLKHCIFWS